jgi:hypothetical protein
VLSAASRERQPPAWAAQGPHAHPAGTPIGPSGPAHPGRQAPRPPPTVVAHPPQDGRHAAAAATSRWSLLPALPQPPASHGRSQRRPGLPGRAAGKRHSRPPNTARSGSAADPAGRRAGAAASSASRLPSAGARAARRCGRPPRPRPVPVAQGAPPHRPGLQRHRLTWTGRTRPDRRGGHQAAGHRTGRHRTGGHRPSGPPDPWTTNPGDRTPDGLDTGRLDSRIPDDEPDGRTPHGGRGPATDATAGVLGLSTTASSRIPSRLAVGTPNRVSPTGPTGAMASAHPGRRAEPSSARRHVSAGALVSCRCHDEQGNIGLPCRRPERWTPSRGGRAAEMASLAAAYRPASGLRSLPGPRSWDSSSPSPETCRSLITRFGW